ncbi:hypothetical protein, partial [Enterobacter cloacae complex sp. 4DZ3-17B2]|uniref:hypothetical protein n=1 Tax=Enterobacter cloacae complex sp. 4DZ3-17B2 TaxID=2511990 RepID=UPI001CA4F99E
MNWLLIRQRLNKTVNTYGHEDENQDSIETDDTGTDTTLELTLLKQILFQNLHYFEKVTNLRS